MNIKEPFVPLVKGSQQLNIQHRIQHHVTTPTSSHLPFQFHSRYLQPNITTTVPPPHPSKPPSPRQKISYIHLGSAAWTLHALGSPTSTLEFLRRLRPLGEGAIPGHSGMYSHRPARSSQFSHPARKSILTKVKSLVQSPIRSDASRVLRACRRVRGISIMIWKYEN
jgi:hypothetical protein